MNGTAKIPSFKKKTRRALLIWILKTRVHKCVWTSEGDLAPNKTLLKATGI